MRVLVLSDIHANLAALKAVLKEARRIGYDEALCLGDLVGYGPDPDECVDLALRECSVVLSGNHDIAACGGIDISVFSVHAGQAMEWTRSMLAPGTLKALSALSPIAEHHGMLLSHGSPEDPVWSYILSQEDAEEAFRSRAFSLCFFGHTHIPSAFLSDADGSCGHCEVFYGTPGMTVRTRPVRALINPGSVGFPRDASDAHASDNLRRAAARYGLFETESGEWRFHRVEYDMRSTADRMARLGLW